MFSEGETWQWVDLISHLCCHLAEGNNCMDRIIMMPTAWSQIMQWKTSSPPRPKNVPITSPSEDSVPPPEGTCSLWMSWTRSNSETALLLGNTGKILWNSSLESPKLLHGAWALHHDSTPAHNVHAAIEFFAKTSITGLDYPPSLPDLGQHIF